MIRTIAAGERPTAPYRPYPQPPPAKAITSRMIRRMVSTDRASLRRPPQVSADRSLVDPHGEASGPRVSRVGNCRKRSRTRARSTASAFVNPRLCAARELLGRELIQEATVGVVAVSSLARPGLRSRVVLGVGALLELDHVTVPYLLVSEDMPPGFADAALEIGSLGP